MANSDAIKDDSDDSRSADLDLTGVVERALVRALALAADAGRLDLVAQLAAELAARRANPDHAAAQALADAVLRGLRAGRSGGIPGGSTGSQRPGGRTHRRGGGRWN